MRPRPAPRPADPDRVRAVLGAPLTSRAPIEDELRPEDVDLLLRRARRPAVASVPAALATARTGARVNAVIAVLAFAVAVACLWAVRVMWSAQSTATSTPLSSAASESAGPTPTLTFVPGATATPSPSSSSSSRGSPIAVVVHVTGQVVHPGLVTLAAGARVADAIAAAGGATRAADLESVNLARLLVDGEQVHVPRPGEPARAGPVGVAVPGASSGPSGGAALVDLNTADAAALDALPGVGPVLAGRILDWREGHGRFTSVDELGEVPGIGDALLGRLRSLVRVGG